MGPCLRRDDSECASILPIYINSFPPGHGAPFGVAGELGEMGGEDVAHGCHRAGGALGVPVGEAERPGDVDAVVDLLQPDGGELTADELLMDRAVGQDGVALAG